MTEQSVTPSVSSPLLRRRPVRRPPRRPRLDAVARMLAAVGYDSLDALSSAAVPETIAWTDDLDLPAAGSEAEVAAELRELASRNTVARSMIGLGYHDTAHPGGHPSQRAREPRLVHRLHAVPARDQPGPARGAAGVPDPRRRPHRPARRGCQPARRAHRRGRGDVAGSPRLEVDVEPLRRGRRHPPADPRGARDPGRAPRRRPRWWSTPTASCPPRTSSACCCRTPARPARSATSRAVVAAAQGARRGRRRRDRPARPHPAHSARRARRRRRRRLRAAARGAARASAARTPASCRVRQGLERSLPGPPRRRERRRRRPAGVPPRAADARAAHPPREGDLEHLHRAGAARRHLRAVRRVPRPGRTHPRSPSAPTGTRSCSPPASPSAAWTC